MKINLSRIIESAVVAGAASLLTYIAIENYNKKNSSKKIKERRKSTEKINNCKTVSKKAGTPENDVIQKDTAEITEEENSDLDSKINVELCQEEKTASAKTCAVPDPFIDMLSEDYLKELNKNLKNNA